MGPLLRFFHLCQENRKRNRRKIATLGALTTALWCGLRVSTSFSSPPFEGGGNRWNRNQYRITELSWRVPNPPGANPLVAERAFPTRDYWGRTGVARCAEEMTGICRDFQRLLTPCHTRLRRPPRGSFSYQGVSTRGLGTRQLSPEKMSRKMLPWGSPKRIHLKPGHLKMAVFIAWHRLDGTAPV